MRAKTVSPASSPKQNLFWETGTFKELPFLIRKRKIATLLFFSFWHVTKLLDEGRKLLAKSITLNAFKIKGMFAREFEAFEVKFQDNCCLVNFRSGIFFIILSNEIKETITKSSCQKLLVLLVISLWRF